MAEVLVLGVSHKTAPLELRERLALTEGRAVGVLGELVGAPEIAEAAAISTCNRTELYLFASDPVDAESHALTVLARVAEIRPDRAGLAPLLAARRRARPTQLFRVTAGLESMIVGETEVQGQVKRAYELALVEDATGPGAQPPLPRRPCRRQAGADRDRDLRGRALGARRSRSSSRSGRSATSRTAACWSSARARPPS